MYFVIFGVFFLWRHRGNLARAVRLAARRRGEEGGALDRRRRTRRGGGARRRGWNERRLAAEAAPRRIARETRVT